METLKTPRKRRLVHAPAGPLVRAFVGNKQLQMRIEKVGRASLFLISDTYVAPRAILELRLEVSDGCAPLRALGSVSYLERTRDGFGLSLEISCLSTEDDRRWKQFLADFAVLAAPTAASSAQLRPVRPTQGNTVVLVAPVLVEQSLTGLRRAGLDVQSVQTVDQALQLVDRGDVKMVVIDRPGFDFRDPTLCSLLLRPCVHTVLLTAEEGAKPFDAGLYAGAAMVASKRCGPRMLGTRLLELFYRPTAAESAVNAAAATATPSKSSAPARRSRGSKLASRAATFLLSVLPFLAAARHP